MTASDLDEHWGWTSWVASAEEPGCDFPLQNLPFCAFVHTASADTHLGVGIGDFILDLHALASSDLLAELPPELRKACTGSHLNPLMECEPGAASLLRHTLMRLVRTGAGASVTRSVQANLVPRATAVFRQPVHVGNYTDFYASIEHASNVGRLFRPEEPLLPNYKFLPIGYHGRASSLVVSGTPVRRPRGQTRPDSGAPPTFGPSRQLDYELEVGAYIGTGNQLGEPIPVASAAQHIFGICLLNDWSARDLQAWEYQPLGPFLGKSFATTLSPWVVAIDALAPFRVPLAPRPPGDPDPLPYLALPTSDASAIDLTLEVYLSTASMRDRSLAPTLLSSANLRDLYWSFPQMIAHHTANGCNLLPGDLLASGTVSGPTPEREASPAVQRSQGSLLEITHRGATSLHLSTGETRTFLEDGDEVTLRGFCHRPCLPRIGLGECRGIVTPAIPSPHRSPPSAPKAVDIANR